MFHRVSLVCCDVLERPATGSAPWGDSRQFSSVISVILLAKARRSSKTWLRSSKALKHMDELFHFTLFAFRFDKRVQTQTAIASCFSKLNSQVQTSTVTLWVWGEGYSFSVSKTFVWAFGQRSQWTILAARNLRPHVDKKDGLVSLSATSLDVHKLFGNVMCMDSLTVSIWKKTWKHVQ